MSMKVLEQQVDRHSHV